MPRKPRIQDKGMIHHIVVRGNNSKDIFYNDNDRIKYLQLLHTYKKRYHFIILAYCFMDNHVHLLVKQKLLNLSDFMGGIQQSYTQYFNTKYKESGHVFEQRFKSYPCSDEAYYISLIAYIHNNPKKAKLVENLDDYVWSSHNAIMGNTYCDICDVDQLFRLIGRDKESSRNEYLWLLGEVSDSELKENYMVGDELEFAESSAWIDERKEQISKRYLDIDEIERYILESEKEQGLKFFIHDYRKIFIALASSHTLLGNKELSDYLEMHPSSVSRIKRNYINGEFDDYINEIINNISEIIL